MKKLYNICLLLLSFSSFTYADIRQDFPSYAYVLIEFDLDESFIDNQDFKYFVEKNKHKYRKHYIQAVKRGDLIVPTLKRMMSQNYVSPILLYISMVESGFKTTAKSRTGAGGLWQFVVNTAKEQHLTINKTIDERYDPVKSTDAALKYLYNIHDNLNKWYLTTMAYNCGNGCVDKAILKAGTTDLGVLISPRNSFIREETKKYIQKVLLMAMIGENYLFKQSDSLGKKMHSMDADSIVPVPVRAGETLNHLSTLLQMNPIYLEKINTHLKKKHTPYTNGYRINIPQSKVSLFHKRYR